MPNRRYSLLRNAATIVLSYILSLFLFLLITGVVMWQTIFSPSYMTKTVDLSGFTEAALPEIQEIYISHAMESGVSAEVLLQHLTPKHIDNTLKTQIRAAYNISPEFDFKRYTDDIFASLQEYVLRQGFEDTSAIDQGLRDLAELCVSDFERYLVSPLIDIIGSATVRYSRLLTVIILAILTLAVFIAVLIKTANRRKTRWLSGYIYALGATAILCAVVPAAIFGSGFAQRLNITPEAYARFFGEWIEGIARGYMFALIPVLLIMIALIAAWAVRRRRHSERAV